MKKSLFVVFDGLDGSGKTENVKRTFQYLLDRDKRQDSILVTREPTNRKYGHEVRKLLINDKSPITNAEKCLELYVKDRKDHVENIIKPVLEQGSLVICDRYKYVTYAYQMAQGNKLEVINRLHQGILKPDIAFIFDLPVEVAMMRIGKAIDATKSINRSSHHASIIKKASENGRKGKEKFEDPKFLREARQNFLKMKDFFPDENIVIINANQARDKVFEEVKRHLNKVLPTRPLV